MLNMVVNSMYGTGQMKSCNLVCDVPKTPETRHTCLTGVTCELDDSRLHSLDSVGAPLSHSIFLRFCLGCNMPAALFWPDCYSLALTLHSTVHSLLLFCPRWRVCVKKSSQERLALKILIDRPKARNEVRQSFPVLCCTWINLACVSAAHTCFFCLWGCHILQHSIWGAPLVGSSLFVFQACSQHASTPDTAGKICTEHLSWIMSFCFWSKYSVSSNSDPGAKIGTPRCCFCSPFHFG